MLDARGSVTFARRDTGLNQYVSWTPPMAATNYDTNDVLTSEGWISASYNALNQPISIWSWRVNPTGNSVSFGYDPLGRCVKRWTGSSSDPHYNPATYFVYDGWNLLQEGSSPWSPAREYVHGARVDEIIYSVNKQTGESAFHQYDARGHCTLLTDNSGAITEQYQYDAFGYPYFFDGSGNALPNGSAFGNRFLFTGREWIKEIAVYDFRNRHYLPELGRFIQPDPKEFEAGDYNLYRYCHNDPVNHSDPTGMFITMSLGHAMLSYCDGQLSSDEFKQGIALGDVFKGLSKMNLTLGQVSSVPNSPINESQRKTYGSFSQAADSKVDEILAKIHYGKTEYWAPIGVDDRTKLHIAGSVFPGSGVAQHFKDNHSDGTDNPQISHVSRGDLPKNYRLEGFVLGHRLYNERFIRMDGARAYDNHLKALIVAPAQLGSMNPNMRYYENPPL